MAQLEAWHEVPNEDLKNHNMEFLKLNFIVEIHRQKHIDFEQKVTLLEVELEISRDEIVQLYPQLAAVRDIYD